MRLINLAFILLTLTYGILIFKYDQAPYFNPNFAGHDARQQLFSLYDVTQPGIFEDDYISRSMSLYMGPLHKLLAKTIVKYTESPIMAGHWIMTVQFGLTVLFVFLAACSFSSIVAACASVIWLLNTPWLIRNTFGGLPRGWAGAILAAFLYFLSRKNHKAIIVLIFIGSMLHPHSTFLVCATYSFYLAFNFIIPAKRQEFKKYIVQFAMACPLIFAVNYYYIQRPDDIGTMVTLKEAENMPAFSKKGGRFPFVPLSSLSDDFYNSSLRIFLDYDGKDTIKIKNKIIYVLILFYGLAVLLTIIRRKYLIPQEFLIFAFSILVAYYLARLFAFRLYVPVRYLAWPPALFFLISMPAIVWKMFESKYERKTQYSSVFGITALLFFIYFFTGSNIAAKSNYKPGNDFDNPAYEWIRNNTSKESVFAGQPSSIDGMPLYGIRRAFVTTETAHPFYDKYAKEIERRIDISFRALYAKDKNNFLLAIGNEKIDYFVFSKKYFKLNKPGKKPTFRFANYSLPHREEVHSLGSRPAEDYFFSNLSEYQSAIVYDSADVTILDIKSLKDDFK